MSLYEENIKQLNEISAFLTLTQPVAINKKYQCTISDAISAFKTLEDMGTPVSPNEIDLNGILTIKVNPNVSRETLEEISNFTCRTIECNTCKYHGVAGICIASMCSKILKQQNRKGE